MKMYTKIATFPQPKAFVTDTRDRFMDYVGNALFPLQMYRDMFQTRPEKTEYREKVYEIWKHLFDRVDVFARSNYTPTPKLNAASFQRFLGLRNGDPFKDLETVTNIYHELTDE